MENLNISASKLQIPTRLKLKDVFLKLKKLTLTIVFYALITNTITLGHFTLTNFKWQISQNSRNVKNHWDFNLDQIILTRSVGRIFTFSCYKTNDLSIGSTETKYIKLNTKNQFLKR